MYIHMGIARRRWGEAPEREQRVRPGRGRRPRAGGEKQKTENENARRAQRRVTVRRPPENKNAVTDRRRLRPVARRPERETKRRRRWRRGARAPSEWRVRQVAVRASAESDASRRGKVTGYYLVTIKMGAVAPGCSYPWATVTVSSVRALRLCTTRTRWHGGGGF
jgi:hypothetical protein